MSKKKSGRNCLFHIIKVISVELDNWTSKMPLNFSHVIHGTVSIHKIYCYPTASKSACTPNPKYREINLLVAHFTVANLPVKISFTVRTLVGIYGDVIIDHHGHLFHVHFYTPSTQVSSY